MFDVVIVGAGFAGSVLARQLASVAGKKVLLVERRRHIAGNCHDAVDGHGVLVHTYGPHLFHTSNREVFEYLSSFTEWHEYQHRVLAVVDGRKVPLPFNLTSLEMLFPGGMARTLEKKLVERFGFGVKVPIMELIRTDDAELKMLADYIYEKIFVHYTVKQWGVTPEDISPEVMERVPVFISRDDRYFQDTYQAVPRHGYTRLFEKMLDHPGIHLLLNTDYRVIVQPNLERRTMSLFGQPFKGELIFTGMIDEFFDYSLGRLPYRTLDFVFETFEQEFFQEVATVNYPNEYDFTRITEFKHIHARQLPKTTVLREFPRDYRGFDQEGGTPSYPIFQEANTALYERYRNMAEKFPALTLVGRLAEYRYYDMDDIVARALEVFERKFA